MEIQHRRPTHPFDKDDRGNFVYVAYYGGGGGRGASHAEDMITGEIS